MKFFHTINLQAKTRRLYLLLIVLTLCLFFIVSYIISFDTKQTALIKGNSDEKQIAFTFNISWGEEKVYDILNVLKKHDIRATFFVSGEWAERHPQIIDDITDQQHELGMLGYRYKNYLEQEHEQVKKDIIYAKNLFKKLGYEDMRYIRPPSGLFNKDIIELAESLELEVVHWSITSNDWENPGTDEILTNTRQATNGDIVLLHASDVAKQTADALELIIDHFNKQKFTYVTISQLKEGVITDESIIE